jgi:hypothetical protein
MSALSLIKNTLSEGQDHLGDLVWWSLSDARIDRASLTAIWTDAGLPAELLPEEPNAERAFKTAIKEAQVGQPGRLLRLAVDTEAEIVFGVVREDRRGDGSLDYHQEARVALNRQREQLTTDAASHDLVVDVTRRFAVLKTTHVADDVRRTLVRSLEGFAAVTLRPSGGIYWVPSPYAAQLRRLQTAIQKVGHSTVSVLPVHRSTEAEATLANVARGSIEDELAMLATEIEGFVTAPPERASTLQRRLEAFETLRDRAKLYRSVLSIQVTDLETQLGRMTATVEGLISKKAA